MTILVVCLILFIGIMFVLAKIDAYEQSPQGTISIVGNVSGADGVDPLQVSVIKLDGDNKISINAVAILPVERIKAVRFYEKNNSIYAGGGHRVNRYYGVLEITYRNRDGWDGTIICQTSKKNQISMIQQYKNMKRAIDRRLGIEEKKYETPTNPYEL